MMKGKMWIAVLGVLALLAGGCNSNTDEAPPQPTAAVQEEVAAEEMAAEEMAPSEVTEEAVTTEESSAAEPTDPAETVEPAPEAEVKA
jgi:hypothetical protein